ncbi:unnamed protein product [Rotaria socialis]|uniref:Enkurin domain-containing protein n=2 Tax=Rotaria socialis TaxID=392032 RepID=A0A820FCU7_9BILA|nr:unnamed protein product [Rotaria socialis]CAF3421292.1 unnamed protein product [Rotaria socialis]CAF4260236.1 unnamed protein product [Rotaria socialis]CAF4379650.1 unnamed protein product [Rotaria socialis]
MNIVDETIYNLLNHLPKCSSSQSSHSKHYYRSIFASNVLQNFNKEKYSHRTMGLATVSKPDPTHPLRRRQNYTELPKVIPLIRSHRMPPIPRLSKQNDRNKLEKPSKNFIEYNIDQMKNSLPICPRRYVVLDRKGNKFLIDGSGLQKDFIYKKNYGKIPRYLEARKIYDEPSNSNFTDNSIILIPPEERLCLINNLKNRYEDTFAEYQRLPLRLETASIIMKKKDLTNELDSIERDLDFLEKHQKIFIDNNYSDINNS